MSKEEQFLLATNLQKHYECKIIKNLEDGIKELDQFQLFEKNYLDTYYKNFSYKRGLIINGGDENNNLNIKFHLTKSSKIIKNSEFY